MSLKSVLITGANRGIGLEFVKQFLKLSPNVSNILATCRKPEDAKELNNLAKTNSKINILKLDVRDFSNYSNFYKNVSDVVGDKGLNYLINNAGIFNAATLKDVTLEKMIETFEVNAVAPLLLTKTLLPLLDISTKQKNRTIIANITADLGSISSNTIGGYLPYRISKTALNQITRSLSAELRRNKIECVAFYPGWVKTDMGTKNAKLTTEQSIVPLVNMLLDSNTKLNGQFLNYQGEVLNW